MAAACRQLRSASSTGSPGRPDDGGRRVGGGMAGSGVSEPATAARRGDIVRARRDAPRSVGPGAEERPLGPRERHVEQAGLLGLRRRGSWPWRCGTRPSSRPATATTGHSRPLAAWNVVRVDRVPAPGVVARAAAGERGAQRGDRGARVVLEVLPHELQAATRAPATGRLPASGSPADRCLGQLGEVVERAGRPVVGHLAQQRRATRGSSSTAAAPRTRAGTPAARRPCSIGSSWALVRTSTAHEDHGLDGPAGAPEPGRDAGGLGFLVGERRDGGRGHHRGPSARGASASIPPAASTAWAAARMGGDDR